MERETAEKRRTVKGKIVNVSWCCDDSLLSVVESPVIHEEQVGRRRISGIDVGGGDKLGPQLEQCRCGANLW